MTGRVVGAIVPLLLGGMLRAQLQLAVEWRLPRDGLAFAEPFEADVVRRWPAGAEPEPFDVGALAPVSLALVDVEGLPGNGERRRYRAVAYATGEIVLPPIVFRARQADGGLLVATYTPPPLSVASLLEEQDPGIEWLDAFEARPRRPGLAWIAAGAAALLLGGFLWQRRRTRPGTVVPAMPSPTPAQVALAALQALEVPVDGASPDDVQTFYRQLAAIVGAYAGRGLPVPASTRTSEELLAAARAGRAALRDCLSRCDAVKFAAHRPGKGEPARAHQLAVTCVLAEAT